MLTLMKNSFRQNHNRVGSRVGIQIFGIGIESGVSFFRDRVPNIGLKFSGLGSGFGYLGLEVIIVQQYTSPAP